MNRDKDMEIDIDMAMDRGHGHSDYIQDNIGLRHLQSDIEDYQARPDTVDHGYRTECQHMQKGNTKGEKCERKRGRGKIE
jgi:hypothetical protein